MAKTRTQEASVTHEEAKIPEVIVERKPAPANKVYCDLDDLYDDIKNNKIDGSTARNLIMTAGKRIRRFDQQIAIARLLPEARPTLLGLLGPGGPTPEEVRASKKSDAAA